MGNGIIVQVLKFKDIQNFSSAFQQGLGFAPFTIKHISGVYHNILNILCCFLIASKNNCSRTVQLKL